jgi:hypothetical protein
MEVPQGNSLCSYLKQAEMSFFLSFAKSEYRNKSCWGWAGDTSGKGKDVGKG